MPCKHSATKDQEQVMFETVTGGLILATVSALAFLAYNHPRQA
jgi:hypothetical protein